MTTYPGIVIEHLGFMIHIDSLFDKNGIPAFVPSLLTKYSIMSSCLILRIDIKPIFKLVSDQPFPKKMP